MSSLNHFADTDISHIDQIYEKTSDYTPLYTQFVNNFVTGVPIGKEYKIAVPYAQVSPHNEWISAKTNIFSTLGVSYDTKEIKLERAIFDLKIGANDPALDLFKSYQPRVLESLRRRFDDMVFLGKVSGAGILNHPQLSVVDHLSFKTLSDYVKNLSQILGTIATDFNQGSILILLPLNWALNFDLTNGKDAVSILNEALSIRAKELNLTVTIKASNLVANDIYVLRKEGITLYGNKTPQLIEAGTYLVSEMMLLYRYCFDSTQILINDSRNAYHIKTESL